MSLNVFKKQVKYCFLNIEDNEKSLLKKKHLRERKAKVINTKEKIKDNLKNFELENKYKTVNKNVVKVIKSKI